MMKSFSIQSFGCRVNQAEGFEWWEALQARGFKPEEEIKKSDLIIVNTCALTAGAERDVRKFFNRVKRENPEARLIVTGCAVKRLAGELKLNNQVEAVLTNEEKRHLPEIITGDKELTPQGLSRLGVRYQAGQAFRSRGLVKIQDGCDSSCSFCLIPRVRGRSVSRPLPEVLARVSELSSCGYREIVLAGVHLTAYGRDLNPSLSLLSLLKEATRTPGIGRIRLSSLDPRESTDDLVDFIASHEKICRHFHFALQHASPRILRLMGRRSAPEDYEKLLWRAREKSPLASLGADIIVGFPGEEEEDFLTLYNLVARWPLTYLHVFPYSPRPGTAAATLPQIPERIKKERARALRDLGRAKNLAFRQAQAGKTLPAVVIRNRPGSCVEVLTTNYIKVFIKGNWQQGQEVKVRVQTAEPEATWGEAVF
ncbi:MAG: tRNA (N(6)-L-threonylcarbamoyladenosine(37)-C(2))-methylthiotransferase MtaB [Candidatus Aminicenantales bacterium]